MLTDKNKLNIKDLTIFKDSPDLLYIYKKTEKLVSAIYLLSNFISDKEPLKWQMRETGLDLLSQRLSADVFKLLSFLEVASVSGLISPMNYDILKYELESLIEAMEASTKGETTKSFIFPEQFFAVPKGQAPEPVSDRELSVRPTIRHTGQSTTSRAGLIIGLLKKDKALGIKDFTGAISDCSEKTIQRELASLVSKGLVIKEGEKRWSRYSLK